MNRLVDGVMVVPVEVWHIDNWLGSSSQEVPATTLVPVEPRETFRDRLAVAIASAEATADELNEACTWANGVADALETEETED